MKRFERDVLSQTQVKYVILGLGVNDILFPGSFVPAPEGVTSHDLILGYRQLIARAHKNGIRVIGTTIPPFEHALCRNPVFQSFYTTEKEKSRQEVNAFIRTAGEFDGMIDFDAAVRDPNRATQFLPAYDSGDHLHVNDVGNVAQGNTIPLALFLKLSGEAMHHQRNWREQGLLDLRIDHIAIALFKHKGTGV